MDASRECYTIEQSTGCVVAHQLTEKDRKILIGINGETAPSQLTEAEQAASKTTQYYEDPPVPLSWEDLVKKRGVKCIDARMPVKQTTKDKEKPAAERRLVWFKKEDSTEVGRSVVKEKSVKEILREQDMLSVTRHTRALERSQFTKVIDPRANTSKTQPKTTDGLTYDEVVDLIKRQAEADARTHKSRDSQSQSGQERQTDLNRQGNNASDSSLRDVAVSIGQCTTPQASPLRHSPLLSPTGSGLTKPFSSNSFRSGKDDLQLALRSEDRRGILTEHQTSSKPPLSSRNGRLHTGSILHKTCAAQGSSVGRDAHAKEEKEGTTYINFVNSFIRPEIPSRSPLNGIDNIHEVATSMVLERSMDSRNEYVEPRHYPNTPVSQPCDDLASSVTTALAEALPDNDRLRKDSLIAYPDRPRSEQGQTVTEVTSPFNSSASDFHELVTKEAETTSPVRNGVSVNIPTAN